MTTKTIAVIAFNGISPFHLSVPCMVFGEDWLHAKVPKFRVLVCGAEIGPLKTSAGFSLETPYDLDSCYEASMIIVPSWRDINEPPPKALVDTLITAHKRGIQIVGLCLGTFVLAYAGLLNGKSATTHWAMASELARRYPQINVMPDVLYVDNKDILTSAGAAAGIDCCLHILRSQYGSEIANCVARRMVVSPHRQGGQAQYIERPISTNYGTDHFAKLLDDMLHNLDKQYSLGTLAERALMSRRTFTRRFRQITGTTLSQWLLGHRLELAQQLLETTKTSIDLIAYKSGFGSALTLRKHFKSHIKTSPGRYRKEFE